MSPVRRFLLILALTCMWAPSFVFIKLAIQDLPPMTIVFARTGLAALIFLSILFCKKRSFPRQGLFWVHSTVLAIISAVFPFSLFCFAEHSIDSALAAILNGSTPMFTAVLSHLFISSDRLNFQKGVGVTVSALGLVLLFLPNLLEGVSGTTLGMCAAGTAAFCYAVSHIYAKKYLTGHPDYIVPGAQLLMTVCIIGPAAFLIEQPHLLPTPSLASLGGVLGLAMFGTVFAYIIYYKLLEHSGPTALSMTACFFPVVGMMLGFIFLGESFSMLGLLAAGIILLGMLLVNQVINLPVYKPKPIEVPYS